MVFRYNINQYIASAVLPDKETINPTNSKFSTLARDIKISDHINQVTSKRKLKELTPENKLFLTSLGFKVL